MIRSLYSGVSGLTTHQTRMDVIGNNIANVNTYGYKTMRATFRDIYYQTAISPSSGKAAFAGNNPSEVGYGVQLGSIDKDMSQSNGQGTNKTYDMMIQADGFFMTATYNGEYISSDLSAREVLFTRMGNFTVDSYGNLATSDNRFVIGTRNSLKGLRNVGALSENDLADVQMKDRNEDGNINSSDITYRNTLNLKELAQTAFNIFTDEFGYMIGYDWLQMVTDNAAQTGNDYVVYDFDGTDDEWGALTAEERLEYVDVQQTLININNDPAAMVTTHENWRYYCDKSGAAITDNTDARIPYATLYGGMNDATDADALKAAKAAANTANALQGELKWDDVTAVTIGPDGTISCTYNGDLKFLARIELATFTNPDGLNEAGGTNFSLSSASGDAKIKNPGTDGAGKVKNKYLEMSNVNLANEFSDMIVTQRGYQANARMITTSDSMLEELVNLKR